MTAPAPRTLAIAQAGGPTPVVNASLVGALREARMTPGIDRVLGIRFGIEGILRNEYADLTSLPEQACAELRLTPNAALGSSRYRPTDGELPGIVSNLRAQGVRWLVIVGGNDTAGSLHRIHGASAVAGASLSVVGIPKTIDNDLPHMDHCPGYGSTARYIALAAREAALDTAAMQRTDPVKVLEVMGRNAGWLAAAGSLGRTADDDPPQIIFLPERPRSEAQMLAEVQAAHERHGWVVIVICENQRDETGRPLGSDVPVYVDPHGHPYFEGAGGYLARTIQAELGLRTKFDRPGSLQRSSAGTLSTVDVDEATAVGAEAVRRAVAGETDVMVAIEREPGPAYRTRLATAPLALIGGQERRLPDRFIAASGTDVTPAFVEYARPLIGDPLPPMVRIG